MSVLSELKKTKGRLIEREFIFYIGDPFNLLELFQELFKKYNIYIQKVYKMHVYIQLDGFSHPCKTASHEIVTKRE